MNQLQAARRRAGRWFVLSMAAFIARFAVRAIGLDEFDLPLEVLSIVAFGMGMNGAGWAEGYETHQREDA